MCAHFNRPGNKQIVHFLGVIFLLMQNNEQYDITFTYVIIFNNIIICSKYKLYSQ